MCNPEPLGIDVTTRFSGSLARSEVKALEAEYHQRCTVLTDGLRDLLGAPRSIFLRMMSEHGTVEATKRIVHSEEPSTTFADLYIRGRGARYLHLTVEAVIRPSESGTHSSLMQTVTPRRHGCVNMGGSTPETEPKRSPARIT